MTTKLLITTTIDVRWGDMDAFGHVNNSVFATYIEEARLRWFVTIDGGWNTDEVGPLVAANNINYRVPIGWPETVSVSLFVERVGNSSLTIGFAIVGKDGSTRYADGNTVLVWIEKKAGRPIVLPDPVKRAIA